MKKFIAVLLAMVMTLSMVACGGKKELSFEEIQAMAETELPATGMMLGENWDEENLPESMFLLIANVQYRYNRDNGQEMPKVDVAPNNYLATEGIELDVLIPAITKYYPFSRQMLREAFENSNVYDARADAVILADGWGWSLTGRLENITDNGDGTYNLHYGMYTTEDTLEYKGVLKATVHPDGYMQFLSNTINNRIFDYGNVETACRKILPLFSITAKIDWDKENNKQLLEAVGTSAFKQIVERLYETDNGKTVENTDGYTAVDNYVTYGTKYFDFDANDIRFALENSYTYNSANDTVLMSDGLGSTIGLKFTELTQDGEIYTVHYDIVYVEDEPDAGQITFKLNDDGSFKFLSGKFIEK